MNNHYAVLADHGRLEVCGLTFARALQTAKAILDARPSSDPSVVNFDAIDVDSEGVGNRTGLTDDEREHISEHLQ